MKSLFDTQAARQYQTPNKYVAIDLETTGLSPERDAIIEIGAVLFQGDQILDRFVTFVNPRRKLPAFIQQLTGIRPEDVANAPTITQVTAELLDFVRRDVTAVVAHNAGFDLGFLRHNGIDFRRPALDTVELATMFFPGLASYNLGELCRVMDIPLVDAHRALDDAEATAQLLMLCEQRANELPHNTITQILESSQHMDEVRWPPLLLFEGAAQTAEDTQTATPPSPLAASFTSPPVLEDEEPTLQPIATETIADLFAATGPLARLMTDADEQYEMRAGQVDMALRVIHALNQGDHLLVEAGTGTGKSLAYCLPALRWSLQNQQRVVIATNTIALQEQLMGKDIPQAQSVLDSVLEIDARSLTAAVLKGRGNYLCLRQLHAWRTSHELTVAELRVLAKVLIWLLTTDDGDVSTLSLRGKGEKMIWQHICSDSVLCTQERCMSPDAHLNPNNRDMRTHDFFWEARQRAEVANIVVVNHALLMADLASQGHVLPPYQHVIIDEAHHLEDVATDQWAYRAEWLRIQSLLSRIKPRSLFLQTIQNRMEETGLEAEMVRPIGTLSQQIAVALQDFARYLQDFTFAYLGVNPDSTYAQRIALDGRVRSQPMWSEIEIIWEQISQRFVAQGDALRQCLQTLDQSQWWRQDGHSLIMRDLQGITQQVDELHTQLDSIILQENTGESQNAVTWLEVEPRSNWGEDNHKPPDVNLVTAPLYVNDALQTQFVHQQRTLILTGATLSTGDGSFGFLQERLGLRDANVATVPSPFQYKDNVLLCMPSDLVAPNHRNYQHAVEDAILDAVETLGGRTLVLFTSYAHLKTTADAIRADLEQMGVTLLQHGQGSRNRLLRNFRQSEHAVLLGTRTFWEGIDLPGEQLQCLIIARLPFAVPSDPLVAARSAEFDNAFMEYSVPDAVIRFRQGFGRLIRRSSDRGVVILLDNRVWRKRYGRVFLDALPTCTISRAPLAELGEQIGQWMDLG
ncbi:MAG: helicase C-terminal domain-containing protein [Chloroflexota bacterium]